MTYKKSRQDRVRARRGRVRRYQRTWRSRRRTDVAGEIVGGAVLESGVLASSMRSLRETHRVVEVQRRAAVLQEAWHGVLHHSANTARDLEVAMLADRIAQTQDLCQQIVLVHHVQFIIVFTHQISKMNLGDIES